MQTDRKTMHGILTTMSLCEGVWDEPTTRTMCEDRESAHLVRLTLTAPREPVVGWIVATGYNQVSVRPITRNARTQSGWEPRPYLRTVSSDHVAMVEYVDFDMLDSTDDEDEDGEERFPVVTVEDVRDARPVTLTVKPDLPGTVKANLMLADLPATAEVRAFEDGHETSVSWAAGAAIKYADDAATDELQDLVVSLWHAWRDVSRSPEVCAKALRRAIGSGTA